MSTLNSETIDGHPNKYEYPHWYSPQTGIYNSTHPPRNLPSDTFLDVVSFLFSCQHKGVSALIDASSGVSIPYSELYSSVKSMASGLHSMGVTKGDVVFVMLPNSIYFPVVLLGVLYSGAIFTPMNPLSSVTEIEKRVADCKPCLAFTVPEKVDVFQKLGVVAIRVPDQNVSFGDFLDFSKLISSDYNLAPRPLIRQEDTAAIMYSSGTTGLSKGVILSHGNFIAMIELFVRFEASQYDDPSSEIVYLAVLPMFHVYGLAYFAMGLFSLGSAVVVTRKFDMNEVAKAVEKYRVTHIAAVPPILKALTKAAKNNGGKSFRSLKQVSCGAAPPSRKMIEELVQIFPHVDFIQGYGMTESTAIGTRGFNTKNCRDYSSAGLLAPNTQAKVVDWKTGSLLPPGKSGELWLRGPGVMKGYLNNDSATMSTIDKDGWLRTGDIAYFDQNGYLYIVDRLKEMIKYKGFQIAPADLEAVLASHPEILDVGVTAVMDEDCGEIPVAFVVRKQGSSLCHEDVINHVARQIAPADLEAVLASHPEILDVGVTAVMDEDCGEIPVAFVVRKQGSSLCHEDVINHVARQVAPYKKIRKVVFTNSIPKSPAGKILRRELRESLTSKL